mgnify:CR=1 FL=1
MVGSGVAILESEVAEVVAAVSERMKEPTYAQLAVGNFVQAQPHVSKYLTAKMERLGGGEAVIHAVFHAEVLAECIRNHHGAERTVSFARLDETSGLDPVGRLQEQEPALAAYLEGNVEARMRGVIAHVGLALVAVHGDD